MRYIIAIFIALAAFTGASAQDKVVADLQKLGGPVLTAGSPIPKLRWESIKKLRDNVNKRDVEAWRAIKTKEQWEKFRDERIAKLRASLGTFPETPKAVKVVTTKKLQGDGFTIECILYETRPNFFVTANLYVPDKADKPMPGFIVIHSHHNPKTQGELQDMGMNWARQGCLVLIPDLIDHGERRQHPFVNAKSYPEKFAVSRQDYFFRYNVNLQLSLVGESLMGWNVWDLMRGVDVLYQRPNIDKSKIIALGSVAGGGDPCAVFAALDQRVTAAAPFNFGGPQPETPKLGEDAEFAFNYMGGGSWESTRNLAYSARDGFLPWVIVGSIAPRGLIYGHEFAWDAKRDPVWARFNKIWGEFYGANDKLSWTKGGGSVRGKPPESTHCNNIGPVHRKGMYPALNKWFGLPVPEKEYVKRFDSSELQCWTDEARKTLKPRMVYEVVRSMAEAYAKNPPKADWAARVVAMPTDAKVEVELYVAGGAPKNAAPFRAERMIVRLPGDPSHLVPALLIRPANKLKITRVVIGIAQGGEAGFLKNRAETIAALLKNKVAICLPDLRGTGVTANDGRGRSSGATSYSTSLLMHGQTVPGVQLQELAMVMNAMPAFGFKSIALWGDSFAEPNDPKMNFAVPLELKLPRQAEPMGGTVALFGALYGGERVKCVYVRGGLVSFRSLLDSPFCYFPHDAVIPGILKEGDIASLVAAHGKRPVRMESLVDGLNRRVDQKELSTPAEVAAWLAAQMRK